MWINSMKAKLAVALLLGCISFIFTLHTSVAKASESIPSREELHNAHLLKFATDTGKAVASIRELVKRYPESSELWEIKADLHMFHAAEVNLFRKRGQIKSSIAASEAAVKINPRLIQPQAMLFSLYDVLPGFLGGDADKFVAKSSELETISSSLYAYAQGLKCVMEQDSECALDRFRHSLAQESVDPDIYIAVIRYLIEEDLSTEASKYLSEATLLYEDYQPLKYQYARFKILQGYATEDIMSILYQVISSYETSPSQLIPELSYLILARAYQISGDDKQAKIYYDRVMESAPRLTERSDFEEYRQELFSSTDN